MKIFRNFTGLSYTESSTCATLFIIRNEFIGSNHPALIAHLLGQSISTETKRHALQYVHRRENGPPTSDRRSTGQAEGTDSS
ncbi:hypothetical protein LTR95_001519 [Oleoguttula sp. CCFEE 5521]